MLAETSGHVRATATVIEGEGLWVSAARAAVATITLFSRASHPHRVFATTADAADWSRGQVHSADVAASDLDEVVSSIVVDPPS